MSPNKSYDTIVVGGGMAGLIATAYQAREGKRVLLIEKNDECGGLVSSFVHNGFHFEAGVRALEDAGIIAAMLKDLGIELEMVNSPVSIGIADKVVAIETMESIDEYEQMLVALYPKSQGEIAVLMKRIKQIMKQMDVLYGVENPLFKDLKKDFKYIFTELLPWMPKFIMTIGKINRLSMPVEEYLERIISDSSLRDVISQYFFKNTPTSFALSYLSLFLDYSYPKGGVDQLAFKVVEKVEELGGGDSVGGSFYRAKHL
jgi:all-trans-retinol 13,14-reductase